MTDLLAVTTTTANREDARKLAAAAIEARLGSGGSGVRAVGGGGVFRCR